MKDFYLGLAPRGEGARPTLGRYLSQIIEVSVTFSCCKVSPVKTPGIGDRHVLGVLLARWAGQQTTFLDFAARVDAPGLILAVDNRRYPGGSSRIECRG